MQLVCNGLTKTYGKKNALQNVNLTFEEGHIYGLIGRNGAGKTTLLSILSNQNPATSGTVTLDGEPVWENRKALGHICFARELNINAEGGLAGYSVKQYLRIAAVYYDRWDKDMASRLVKLFELEPKAKLSKLSKGMLSMLTITVALASKATFTFLDEPVAGLDVIARQQFYRLLLEEYSETGRTFVISTHIIEEAADLFEEIVVINKGAVMLKEDTQALLGRARYITGEAQAVEEAVRGLEQHGMQSVGRSKAVTVLLKDGEAVQETADVTVQPMDLQQLFVALCGEEEHA